LTVRPLVLTIGAFHVGADAGVVADAAVVAELDGRCACVATGFAAVEGDEPVPLPAAVLAAQLAGAAAETPRATRVGWIGSERDAREIALVLQARAPDAVVLAPELPVACRAAFLPLAVLAIVRAGAAREIDALRSMASRLRDEGAAAVLVAGASFRGRVVDLLDDSGRVTVFDTSRIQAPRIAGLAGSHATALAAHLARGASLVSAAAAAQRYVALRLRRSR
jgi:hydroxymethylpyrimidine/phosphomethylpyrimidine kinase